MKQKVDPVEILTQLVQIASITGEEGNLAQYLYDFCIKQHLPVEKQDQNIVIKFLTGSKKCLIFNAHMDTVQPGDLKHWQFPPFGKGSGIIRDKKLYGLGASDDKAGIAALIALALQFRNNTIPVDLFFVFVVGEEVNTLGSKSFVKYFKENYRSSYKDIATVIAEPTDLAYLELGYRSNCVIKITTFGDSGHASRPEEIKKHSIYQMINVINKINDLETKLQTRAVDKFLGKPTIALVGIQTLGSSWNKIPSTCSSFWNVRVTPKIEKNIADHFEQAAGKEAKIETLKVPGGCVIVNPKEKIVKTFQQVVPNIKIQCAKGANDTGCFVREGIPAITFGPGHKAVIHKENEYVEVKNIKKATEIYKQIVNQY